MPHRNCPAPVSDLGIALLWVPHEIVILSPAPTGIGLTPNERVGYVLADDPDGWITILTSGDRTIVRFRDATVKSITVQGFVKVSVTARD
jgi:hypothetical protein